MAVVAMASAMSAETSLCASICAPAGVHAIGKPSAQAQSAIRDRNRDMLSSANGVVMVMPRHLEPTACAGNHQWLSSLRPKRPHQQFLDRVVHAGAARKNVGNRARDRQ